MTIVVVVVVRTASFSTAGDKDRQHWKEGKRETEKKNSKFIILSHSLSLLFLFIATLLVELAFLFRDRLRSTSFTGLWSEFMLP